MLENLQNKIIEEFQDIPYPGDDNIVPHKPYLDIESDRVKEFFKGKNWKNINIHHLINDYTGDHSACLIMMTPEAFRYYLPAYMLICIQDYEEADVSYETLFYKLTKGMYGENFFEDRLECLADNAKKVISEFIWTMHSLHGHDAIPYELEAFNSYWNQYYQPETEIEGHDT